MKPVEKHLFGQGDLHHTSLRIIPIEGRRDRRRFIRVPWSIYADDPAWVPPLLLERHQHLSPRNPYFSHAQCRFWMACRGQRPVGRISAQIDQLHLQRYQDACGFFGMLEAEDNPETFKALMQTAEGWLRSQGMRCVQGPFNLSINQESGLLVEGFDTPPSIMMGHARPYYARRIEENGYHKTKDLLAYWISADFKLSGAMQAVMAKAATRTRVRPLRRADFKAELKILQDIFEDAWSRNWNFIPFTKAEFADLGLSFKFLLDDGFVQIAEVDGEPAAMIIGFPNFNEIIQDLDGRLMPWGWLKLLWRLKKSFPRTARVPLMGVRRQFQGSRMGAALAFMVVDAVRTFGFGRGIRQVELSWILEDNTGMRNIIEAIGGEVYKRYRVFSKNLD